MNIMHDVNFGAILTIPCKLSKHQSPIIGRGAISSTQNVFSYSCVCLRVTWVGGADGSYSVRSPREDWFFGYDALALMMPLCV